MTMFGIIQYTARISDVVILYVAGMRNEGIKEG